jgi:hypothetical protein
LGEEEKSEVSGEREKEARRGEEEDACAQLAQRMDRPLLRVTSKTSAKR